MHVHRERTHVIGWRCIVVWGIWDGLEERDAPLGDSPLAPTKGDTDRNVASGTSVYSLPLRLRSNATFLPPYLFSDGPLEGRRETPTIKA